MDNGDGYYSISLQVGKAYKIIRPERNDRPYEFRVIDEEGEDYLYPRSWFVPVELGKTEKRRVTMALAANEISD